MAMPTYMKKSDELPNPTNPRLPGASAAPEFPEAPDFVSRVAPVPIDSVLELSRYYLPRLGADAAFRKARAEERCLAEFDLFHPERVEATYPVELINDLLRGV
jgi:hypothetical protein